jgi:hypothetical protein
MNHQQQSRLAGVAASLPLTTAEAVVAPAVLDRFALTVGRSADSMLAELELNSELRAYFGLVCRNVAKTDVGQAVAADYEASR